MGKLLLKQDEMILLKNSEAVKNIETYGNMYDCVMPYKVLSEIDLQKNELFNTKARATILIRIYYFKKLRMNGMQLDAMMKQQKKCTVNYVEGRINVFSI